MLTNKKDRDTFLLLNRLNSMTWITYSMNQREFPYNNSFQLSIPEQVCYFKIFKKGHENTTVSDISSQ